MSNLLPYFTDDLAHFRREYADTEWMVHASGPDDVYVTEGGLDEDDPDAKPMTRDGAVKLVAELHFISGRMNADLGPDPEGFTPRFIATAFHRGKPYEEQMFPAAHVLRWAAQVMRKDPEHKHPWETATADLWEHAAEDWTVDTDEPKCPNCGEGCGGHGAEWFCASCGTWPVGSCTCIHGLAYRAATAFLAALSVPVAAASNA
jgi:ribosomal protein S27AE